MRLTVRQNLSVFAQLYAVADIAARIAALAADLDLDEFLDRPTGKLSAGQKTRVSLAKALLNRPEVLLLDEPTASLDPDTADWVRARLEDYRRAHRRDRAARLAQHDRGRAAVRARHHHEARPHRGRRHAGSACLRATAARRWKRCSSTSRAGATRIARPHNDRQRRGVDFSVNRVAAMVRRYWYLLRSSWPRMLDLIYWPTVQMLMWGFLQLYVIAERRACSRAPAACSSARCCCGTSCSAASSAFRFRSSRKCGRAISAI